MTGWQCPGCGRCYAPGVLQCGACLPPVTTRSHTAVTWNPPVEITQTIPDPTASWSATKGDTA